MLKMVIKGWSRLKVTWMEIVRNDIVKLGITPKVVLNRNAW